MCMKAQAIFAAEGAEYGTVQNLTNPCKRTINHREIYKQDNISGYLSEYQDAQRLAAEDQNIYSQVEF
jgi:hypothetical protein